MAEEPFVTSKSRAKPATPKPVVLAVVGAVIIAAAGFFGGVAYQKHHGDTASSTAQSRFADGPGGFGQRRMNGSLGSVTAVSDTSITVQDQRSGTSKTYTIDSSTSVTSNGAAATDSDIKIGDTVLISTSSSTSTTATRILLNPSFGGGPAAGGGDDSTQSN